MSSELAARATGRWFDIVLQIDSLTGIPEFHGDSNSVDGDVGGPELGAVIVGVLAEPRGDLAGLGQVLAGPPAVVFASRGDCENELASAIHRELPEWASSELGAAFKALRELRERGLVETVPGKAS